MQQVTIAQAKTNLEGLIQAVLDGDDVVLMQHGEPVVQLIAAQPLQKRRSPGTAKGQITIAPDFDEPLEEFVEHMQ